MIQLYNENFTLNLSDKEIQFSETNGWFEGDDFTQYSIPFTLQWSANNRLFLDLLNSSPKRLYSCWMTLEGRIRKAELEILEYDSRMVECSIYYGFNALPGSTKLMSEFNFPIIQTQGIYDFVETIIGQNISDTPVNFPRIIKEYDTNDEGFENYPGLLNHFDADDGYDFNGQILRPYPYLLYVLRHCLEHEGFSVSGSFFENEHLKEALFITHNEFHYIGGGPELVEYFQVEDIVSETLITNSGQTANVQHFKKSIPPNIILYSNINLKFLVPAGFDLMGYDPEVIVSCNGVIMHQQSITSFNSVNGQPGSMGVASFLVNQSLVPSQIGHPIEVEWKLNKAWDDEDLPEKFEIKIYPLTTGGNPQAQPLTVVNPNHVDINRLFPKDMTFGDFFELIQQSCKPLVQISQSDIKIDLGNTLIDNRRVVNLTKYQKKWPKRSFDSKATFEIKYEGGDSDPEIQNAIFIDKGNVETGNYLVQKNTESIELRLQPLFFETVNNIKTAVIKSGLTANMVFYNHDFMIYNCIDKLNKAEDWYNFFLKEFIRFKLNPETLKFNFIEDYRFISELKVDSFIFIHNSLYLLKEVEKKQLQPYLLEYEIEAVKYLT